MLRDEALLHELYTTEHTKEVIFPGHPDVSQGTCGTRSPQPAESHCPSSQQTSKIFSNTLVFPGVKLVLFCVPSQHSPFALQAYAKIPVRCIPAWLKWSPLSSPTDNSVYRVYLHSHLSIKPVAVYSNTPAHPTIAIHFSLI